MLRAVAASAPDTGAITIGQAVTGGTPSTLIYNDSGGLIANSATIPFLITNSGLTTTSPGWYAQITGDAVPRVRVGLNATDIASIGLGSGAGARDAFIERVGAGSLRFGAPAVDTAPVAQTLSVQNTLAGGTSNVAGANFTIAGSQGKGTGVGGSLIFQVAPAGSTGTAVNALATAWTITGAGHLLTGTDNTYDIGANGATRPRNVYVGTNVTAGGQFSAGSASYIQFTSRTAFSSPSDGLLLIQNQATTDFGRLQFGGTTSSFPALKRSATILQARLADDSAYAPLQGKLYTDTNATTGLTAGVLSALTNADIVIYDASGQAYRVPCII